jgi:hypothetical protein
VIPAKRAEMKFQMQAMMNIEVLNAYEAKKLSLLVRIVLIHSKNEYPIRRKISGSPY